MIVIIIYALTFRLKEKKMKITYKTFLAASVAMGLSSTAFAQDSLPSREDMWKMIQQQQKQIEALSKQQSNTDKKVEKTVDAVEEVKKTNVANGNTGGWWNRTSVGGYGEMHYNASSNSDDEIDFHRYVLFLNHEFNDRIRMFSELELEHSLAGEGKNGEVELEQAFVELDLDESGEHKAKAGLFLIPVGLLNETHEPPTFFGVERNPVESNIIPTTWWEGGVGYSGQLGNGFSTDVAVHGGLNTPITGANAYSIRSARQKVSEAKANDGAITGRLSWSGMPGVKLAATAQYQQDITQGNATEEAEAVLLETHADIRKGPFGFRALYARWDIDGAGAAAVGKDEQFGWYVEPSYRFDTDLGEFGAFARYNVYDTAVNATAENEIIQTDVGMNYWPHPQVVFKGDVAFIDNPTSEDDEVVNLGVGFQF